MLVLLSESNRIKDQNTEPDETTFNIFSSTSVFSRPRGRRSRDQVT